MPIKCQFNLSRSSAVYYTGEQISGTLTLSVTKKPVQLEAISITLIGLSSTSWSEPARSEWPQIEHNDSSTGCTKPNQINYGAKKTHIEQTEQLMDSAILLPGSTQLGNFKFELPSCVPGSCRLGHGSINYFLQVSLERRGKHSKQFQQRLCIRKSIEFLELRPATHESATLCLSLPRSVFVPGQRVAYQLQSTVPQTNCQFNTRLCQSIRYESQQPLAKFKNVVRVLDESCDMAAALHLPLTAPIMTQLPGEPIEINYYLETLSTCSKPLRIPLFVGTVAPPVDAMKPPMDCPSLGFVNLALSENELLFSSINQLLPHTCSREPNTTSFIKHCEHLKLLRRQKKKQSYVRLALRYFYKNLLPAN